MIAEKFPVDIAAEINEMSHETGIVKIYKFAHRYCNPDGSQVAFFWDCNGPGKLKIVQSSSLGNSYVSVIIKCDNVLTEVRNRAVQLIRGGFTETADFWEYHRMHLPCFSWVLSDSPPSDNAPVTSSRIGGAPATYKNESLPSDMRFMFQIDCSTVPPRMQKIVKKNRLLQFFHSDDFFCDGFVRVIPVHDFSKLKV